MVVLLVCKIPIFYGSVISLQDTHFLWQCYQFARYPFSMVVLFPCNISAHNIFSVAVLSPIQIPYVLSFLQQFLSFQIWFSIVKFFFPNLFQYFTTETSTLLKLKMVNLIYFHFLSHFYFSFPFFFLFLDLGLEFSITLYITITNCHMM